MLPKILEVARLGICVCFRLFVFCGLGAVCLWGLFELLPDYPCKIARNAASGLARGVRIAPRAAR